MTIHLASIVTFLLALAPTNHAAVLTFEDLAVPSATVLLGSSISSQADNGDTFTITTTSPDIQVLGDHTYNYSGSTALSTTGSTGDITFTRESGQPFNLGTIDISSSLGTSPVLPFSVTLTASTDSGQEVRNFQTLVGSFTPLTYAVNIDTVSSFTVTFNGSLDEPIQFGGQIDNIVYTAVPEPSSFFLLSATAFGFLVRRRRKN